MNKEYYKQQYHNVFDMNSSSYYRVRHYQQWAIINKHTGELMSKWYDFITPFKDGLARVQSGDKMTYINKQFEEVMPFKYNEVFDFYDGVAKVSLKTSQTFINKNFEELMPHKYYVIEDRFTNGLCKVTTLDFETKYIDKNYEEIELNVAKDMIATSKQANVTNLDMICIVAVPVAIVLLSGLF